MLFPSPTNSPELEQLFLEFGSNSLKIFAVIFIAGRLIVRRVEKKDWMLTFDVLHCNLLGEGGLQAAVEALIELEKKTGVRLRAFRAYATGIFREARDCDWFCEALRIRTGLELIVLSPFEEARLLFDGLSSVGGRPPVLFDLGGATLQICFAPEQGKPVLWSFPFGAVRLHVEHGNDLAIAERYQQVRQALVLSLEPELSILGSQEMILGTGGTLKAVHRAAEDSPITASLIQKLAAEASRGRFPTCLSERRCEVFLPGLLCLDALVETLWPRQIRYEPNGLARGLGQRLIEDSRRAA